MENTPRIFVIIVTYKGQRWYDKCLGSLRESIIPIQTIIVDNSPGEEDANYIRTNFPEVHLIKTNENLGFGRANNLGMRYALDNGCDYVFLLNQDTWIEPNSIAELVEIHKENSEYSLLSPMHINPQNSMLGMLLDDGSLNYKILSDYYVNDVKKLYPIVYVNAAAWLLPTKTLEIIGGFCPLFFHYGEDDDFLNRLRFHKMSVGLCPHVRIYHDSGAPLDGRELLRKRAQEEGLNEFVNINNTLSINIQCLYYLRKIFTSVLRLEFEKLLFYFERFYFIVTHLKKISFVVHQQKKCQANWLKVNMDFNL